MATINKDLDRWSNIQLSLMGKIAVVKSNILPRLLYLFQTAPVKLNKIFFDNLNKKIRKFIWMKKKARIKTKNLQDHRKRGGFGLPNFKLYYYATILKWLREWILLKDQRLLTLEGFDLQRGWHAFLGSSKNYKYTQFKQHYIRKILFEVWQYIRKHHYRATPKWISPTETIIYPNLLNLDNIVTYEQLLDSNNELIPKQTLLENGIKIDWFHYLQIKSKYNEDKANNGFQKVNTLDKILFGPNLKMISKIYSFLLDYELVEEEVKGTMVAWAQNFGYTIYLNEWEKIWKSNYKLTLATSYKENLYKMFYRWHLPPARIAKMFPNMSPKCWKCKKELGTYYHTWWTCPNARAYWQKVKSYLEQITSSTIKLKPELFLLGINRQKFDKDDQYLILHILTAARITYAQLWKEPTVPTTFNLITKIMECAELAKLTMELQDRDESDFYQAWEKWYKWLKLKKYLNI